MRIAFTHNLKRSNDEAQAEFDAPETIQTLSEMLRGLGHEVHPIDVSGSVSQLVARLEALNPDMVFNTAEGSHGRFREAFYPALFEQLRLPFTGSGAHACSLTLDKQATKLLAGRAGVPTPRWAFFDETHPLTALPKLRFPLIVKPNFEGSSKGITAASVVHDEASLRALIAETIRRYPEGVLVEEFIIGRDVTVPYLERVGVLSPAAYRFEVEGAEEGYVVYDYALKNEHPERVEVEAPARLPLEQIAQLKALTLATTRALEIRDMARVDFRVTPEGEIFLIEINALPSLEPGASIYEAAALEGLEDEPAVLEVILESAAVRHAVTPKPPRIDGPLRVGLAHNVRRMDPKHGDDDAEFDAPRTIEAITEAIARLGHEVVPLEATPSLPRLLGDLELDLVFNIAEGLRGRSREAQIPALLDLFDIPYTGSDAAALAVTLDKGLAKRLVREAGVSTPRWALVHPGKPIPPGLRYPLIVKPNAEGSSKGITDASVARDEATLLATLAALHARYRAPALVEEFLPGREFTVGILGDEDPQTLPIMEIRFAAGGEALPIYTYAHKIEADLGVSFQVPAEIDDALAARLREVALASFEALGCRDVARIDLRLDAAGEPHFIECNPLPGLNPGFSDLCVMAEAAGLDHAALIAAILAPAVRRLMLERVEASA